MSSIKRENSSLSVEELSEKYKAVINSNFERKENELVN